MTTTMINVVANILNTIINYSENMGFYTATGDTYTARACEIAINDEINKLNKFIPVSETLTDIINEITNLSWYSGYTRNMTVDYNNVGIPCELERVKKIDLFFDCIKIF